MRHHQMTIDTSTFGLSYHEFATLKQALEQICKSTLLFYFKLFNTLKGSNCSLTYFTVLKN